MKGMILCAGHGTRLRPFTYSRPKCTVPVNGVPVIVSIVEQFVKLGINDIGVVLNATQHQIRRLLGNGSSFGASISYFLQDEALGLAHAVQAGRSFLQDGPFFLMLGDNLVNDVPSALIEQVANGNAEASLLLARVDDPRQFGVATLREGIIVRLDEKPAAPMSDLAIVGVYAFGGAIFQMLDRLQPSARGEYEITDAIMGLIEAGARVTYSLMAEPFFDIGNPDRWLAANRFMLDRYSVTAVGGSKGLM
ncbi:NTP transferase domain-containing protein [Paenibacillus lycopersici]|uniref:Glucose-1-phosphate thymidylyltransferase n=1 Tax=Paenibacillus lycopersici TaxID=2704462 RepID=A0A6C0FWV7_9BACL|nr:sugar phosphate nucleotidyltransferase [Paenibacillus lycopersici]QHT61606.1 NTP transferase domain-containing protein [Paenibacillus lycopersici]